LETTYAAEDTAQIILSQEATEDGGERMDPTVETTFGRHEVTQLHNTEVNLVNFIDPDILYHSL
jgi:hypothetical protein